MQHAPRYRSNPARRWRRARAALAAFALSFCISPNASADATAEAPDIDRVIDAFVSIREFGLVRASPDGAFVVVEVMRPRTSRAHSGALVSLSLSDLWLVNVTSGEARRLTSGEREGSSAWEPIWSPDSRKIAYLTNEGDGLARAAWMDVRSRRGGLLSNRGVDIEVNFGSRSPYAGDRRIWGAWISDDRFLMAASAQGDTPPQLRGAAPETVLPPLWASARQGQTPITVWDSQSNLQCNTSTRLISAQIGARSRERELIVGSVRAVTLAPDRRTAAIVMATGALAPPARGVIDPEMNYYHLDPRVHTRLGMLNLDGAIPIHVLTATSGVRFQSSNDAPRWTSDSRTLFAPRFERAEGGIRNFCVEPVNAMGDSAHQWEIECSRIISRGHAQLLALSLSVAPPTSVDALDNRIRQTALTMEGSEPAQDAAIFSLGQNLVGLASASSLKLIDPATGQTLDQISIEGLALALSGPPSSNAAIAIVQIAGEMNLLAAEANRLLLQPLRTPETSISPLSIVTGGDALVWASEDLQGKSLWLSDRNGENWRRVMRLERPFPADLQFDRQAIHYELPDGRPAIAIALLPANYDPSRPYPVILDVYPALTFRDHSVETQFNPNSIHSVEAYTFASLGYVVVRPSMPRYSGALAGYEPLDYYSAMVEAFAQEAIARRLTLPGQIGLWGHSNGGYLGLGVGGRTTTINAIVSSSPFPDIMQVADWPAPLFTTDACAPNRLYGASLNFAEDPNGPLWRMGAPSYQALDRYIRNSPLYQLGPQTPPTLIVQGENDGRGTADAERVYTRLNRQNVPVQLARYWSEGHNFMRAEAVRDRVRRAVDWYGAHLIDAPRATPN